MKATSVSMYASTTHCWPASPVSRSDWIAGRATLTTVESRKTIVDPRIVASRVRRSRRVIGSSLTNASSGLGLGRLAELVRRGEEVAVRERRRNEAGEGDGAKQDPEQDQLEAHGVGRLGAGEQHPDHRSRE